MRVLVVHDRDDVRSQIKDVILGAVPHAIICEAVDGIRTREKLTGTLYDFAVVDLTIPNVKGRGNVGFSVIEGILEELFAGSPMLVPSNLIGITRDADALDLVNNNIGPHLMAVLREVDGDDDWKKQLGDRTLYAENAIKSKSSALLTRYDYDALIFTALDKELSPYRDLFEISEHPQIPGLGTFFFTDLSGKPRKGACFAIGRAGQPSAASEAQGLICQLRPKLAIMTGFCGGIPKKAEFGDILFAEMALDWDYGKWKPNESVSRLYARPEPISIRNSAIHRIARDIVEHGLKSESRLAAEMAILSNGEILKPSFKLIPFASGSAVIGDHDVLGSVKSLNESVGGVDMESYGFYYACRYPHAAAPEFLCIKAVADDCGIEKDDRLHKVCCFASAFVAKEIMCDQWSYE